MPRDLELPPLKPVLTALAALLVVVVIVLIVSGGDDESPSRATEGDPAAESGQNPAGGRANRRRTSRRPQKLAAAIGPRTLRFSAGIAQRSRPQTVRATNRGGARIRLGKVRLQGRRAGFVMTDGCSGTRLSRGQTCLVVVSFAPPRRRGADTTATVNGTVIFTNDGKGGRQTVALRANRLAR